MADTHAQKWTTEPAATPAIFAKPERRHPLGPGAADPAELVVAHVEGVHAVMPRIVGTTIGRELCEIFGLDADNVCRISLDVQPAEALMVVVSRYVEYEELARITEVLRRYDLVLKDETAQMVDTAPLDISWAEEPPMDINTPIFHPSEGVTDA